MHRRFLCAALLLTAVATSVPGHAWARIGTGHPALPGGDGSARAQVRLQTRQFGEAVIHGTDADINAFATAHLLARAPSHHLVNLLHLLNIPGAMHFRIEDATVGHARATITWIFSPQLPGVVDRLFWVEESGSWRIAQISHLRG